MLRKLSINNYALIDRLETGFGPGLTVITGETGSGKSIMLGALSLLLGGRADTKAIRRSDRKSVIEAVFDSPDPHLKGIVEKAGPEWNDEELIVRRELSPSGRSRAFVNDSPVTLLVLQELMPRLIDIHSQHQNLQLSDPRHQLRIIDAMAENSDLRDEYKSLFHKYVKLRQQIETLRSEMAKNRENREFMLFQLQQLDKLKPLRGELEEIERQFDLFSDAGEIKEQLASASALIGGSERSAVAQIAEARAAIGRIDLSLFENDTEAPGIQQRLESLYVELKDIAATVEDFASGIEDDPVRLAKISKRMDDLYEAQKRFNVADNDALVSLHEELKRNLGQDGGSDEILKGLEAELRDIAGELKTKAARLSATRVKAAEEFSEMLTATAMPLGLPNLKFSAMVSKGKLHSDGMDSVAFLCRFNKNQDLMPLEKAASGGEMSRLMLSLKETLSTRLKQPTVIFDEIDTGVSGEIADRMGRMMHSMGESTQVMAITHLPQVASKGDSHFKVFKTDNEDSTVTRLTRLSPPEREHEIAKMLSGDRIDDAALENARSLLATATNPNN